MDMPLSDWYLAAWWMSRKTLSAKEEKSRGRRVALVKASRGGDVAIGLTTDDH